MPTLKYNSGGTWTDVISAGPPGPDGADGPPGPTGPSPVVDDALFVQDTGDTMTGALTLPANPVAALEAAPKQYVDSRGEPTASMWGSYPVTAAANGVTTFLQPESYGDSGVAVGTKNIVLNRTGFYFIVHNGDFLSAGAGYVPYGKRAMFGIKHKGAWVACGSFIWNETRSSAEALIWGEPGDLVEIACWQNAAATGYNTQSNDQNFSVRFLGENL